MKNIDTAMEKLRKLHAALFDASKTRNDWFQMSNELMNELEEVSRDIKKLETVPNGE